MSARRQPEMAVMPDTGCRVHPSCRSCPLARCVLDVPLSVQQREARDAEIRRLRANGLIRDEVAVRMDVSLRTVSRAVEGMAVTREERRYEAVVSEGRRGRSIYRVYRGERLLGVLGRDGGRPWEVCTPDGHVVPLVFDTRHQAADALEALA